MPGTFALAGAPLGGGAGSAIIEELSDSTSSSDAAAPNLLYLRAISQGVNASDGLSHLMAFGVQLSDSVEGEATSAAEIAPYLRDGVTAAANVSVIAALNESLASGASFDEAIVIAMAVLASDTAAITDSLTSVHRFFGAIQDALVIAGVAYDRIAAQEAVIAAAALESMIQAGWSVEAVSTAAFQSALLSELRIMVGLAESAAVASGTTPTLRLSVLATDNGEADDAISTSLAFTEILADGATIYGSVSLGGIEYAGWVLNTGLRAVTEYRNFPFNSFAKWKGRYYGFREEGLYLLEGDDDAGEPIDAWVRGALQTFATNRFKRVPDLYLGYKADGQMLLKAVSRDEVTGDLTEDWYVLEAQEAASHREGRIKLGRGLKSVYWAFELRNVDGADFALDEIALRPLILDRRI